MITSHYIEIESIIKTATGLPSASIIRGWPDAKILAPTIAIVESPEVQNAHYADDVVVAYACQYEIHVVTIDDYETALKYALDIQSALAVTSFNVTGSLEVPEQSPELRHFKIDASKLFLT